MSGTWKRRAMGARSTQSMGAGACAGLPIVDVCLDRCPEPAVHLSALFDVQRCVLDGHPPTLPVSMDCGCVLLAYGLAS